MHNVDLCFAICYMQSYCGCLQFVIFQIITCEIVFILCGATFAELLWQFIGICSCFIRDLCLSVVKRAWLIG